MIPEGKALHPMSDRQREWLKQRAEAARARVSGAPPLEIGPIDDTHTYPIRFAAPDVETPLLTRIPDTWAERRDEKRVMRALVDALRHHLEG